MRAIPPREDQHHSTFTASCGVISQKTEGVLITWLVRATRNALSLNLNALLPEAVAWLDESIVDYVVAAIVPAFRVLARVERSCEDARFEAKQKYARGGGILYEQVYSSELVLDGLLKGKLFYRRARTIDLPAMADYTSQRRYGRRNCSDPSKDHNKQFVYGHVGDIL